MYNVSISENTHVKTNKDSGTLSEMRNDMLIKFITAGSQAFITCMYPPLFEVNKAGSYRQIYKLKKI